MTEPTEHKPRRTMADLIADDRRAVRDMRTVPNPQVPHPDALPRTLRKTPATHTCDPDGCDCYRNALRTDAAIPERERLRTVAREAADAFRAAGSVGRGSDGDLAGDEQAVEIAEIEARWVVHPLGSVKTAQSDG